MTSEVEERHAEPLIPTDDVALDTALHDVLPMLIETRDTSRIVEFSAPTTSGLPTEPVALQPYYMNKLDPKDLGIWKFRQDGYPNLYIYSRPGSKGAEMRLSDRLTLEPEGAPVLEDTERIKGVTGLLSVVSEAYTRQKAEGQARFPEAKRRAIGRMFTRRPKK